MKSLYSIIASLLAMLLAVTPLSAKKVGVPDGVGRMQYFTCPSKGDVRFPVIIVEYPDVKLADTDSATMAHFNDMFNAPGYNYNDATGSVRDYFLTSSRGAFRPRFDVLGVVRLNHPRTFYGEGEGTDGGQHADMVIEGLTEMMNRGVDFSSYDSDHDGYIDNVVVVFAGNGERFGDGTDASLPTAAMIHFKKWGDEQYADGMSLGNMKADSYTLVHERAYNDYDGIGTFTHEFSHTLGLGDSYNLWDPKCDYTPRKQDVMDIGMYNNNRRTPPSYSAYERYIMGWIKLEVLKPGSKIKLTDINSSSKAYILPVSDTEFFVIECRRKQGWDEHMPQDGLMVWHIDYDADRWYNNAANMDPNHQSIKLDIVTDTSYRLPPTYLGTDTGLILTHITDRNGVITARVERVRK